MSTTIKRCAPLSEVNIAACPKEEVWISKNMSYMPTDRATGSGLDIAMLSGGHKHPCDMVVHQKAEDNMLGHPSSELRYLEMHQAVSFLLRQESG